MTGTTSDADPDAEAFTAFERAVTAVLEGLDVGEVVTYGEVALEAGYPGAARAVGRFLHDHGDLVPWWRVVTVSGRLVPGMEADHARRLEGEGVATADHRVRFDPKTSGRTAG